MTRFTESEIEEVRSRADILEVVGVHVRLRRAGRNFVGLCPFHSEKTPSFTVNLERGFFHCFGCGAGGSVFDFVMKVEGLTFPEALQSLARRYGIALAERAPAGEAGRGFENERASMFAANQLAADFYTHVLWNTSDGEVARDYLKTRGINGETARAFMLGFAPPRTANLATTLYKRALLEPALKLGLARRDETGTAYDMFRSRMMFPIRDVQGRVIGFGGRVLDSRLPKYINSAESPLYSKGCALYGLAEARAAISKADRAIVVEGYIDAIALWQAGFKEAVATLGTALTLEQLRLLSRYTRNILACFDGDQAGRTASLRALDIFLQAGLLARGVFIPQGYDPDTLVQQRGAAHFSSLLQRSELLIEMFLRQQAELAPKGRAGVDARARVLATIGEKLRLIKDEFQFNLLVRQAVDLVGFTEREEAVLRRAGRGPAATVAAHRSLSGKLTVSPVPHGTASPDAVVQAELGLIALALHYPELRSQIRSRNCQDLFVDRDLASLLEQVFTSDESSSALDVAVCSRLEEHQRGWFSRMVIGSSPKDDPAKICSLMEDYVTALDERRRRREIARLRGAALEGKGDEAVAAAQALIVARRRDVEP